MAKFNSFFVTALLACLVAVNASVLQDEEGNPCPSCVMTREYNIVCGTNGRNYANPSVLHCHSKCLKSGMRLKHAGRCHAGDLSRKAEEENHCVCAATADYNPVCGTNGETYVNRSVMRCEAKCKKTDIEIKHEGHCA